MSNMSLEEVLEYLTPEQYEEVRLYAANLLRASHTERLMARRRDFPEHARRLDFA